jgi:hypothetical protein
MAVDYQINLAKSLTSSNEERNRFYNGMLIYLVGCAAALVLAAYFTSINLSRYIKNRHEQRNLIRTALAVSGLEASTFKSPDRAYKELQKYSDELASLRQALGLRTQLLPIIHNLFKALPTEVELKNLTANKSKVIFGINVPAASESVGDPVRKLKTAWENNEQLMKHVASIRPIKGQRRTMGSESVFHVQFECILKK